MPQLTFTDRPCLRLNAHFARNGLALSLAALVLFGVSLGCIPSQPNRQVVTFHHNYHSLVPGKSTLKDAVRVFGRYQKAFKTPNGHNYRFPKVVINISGRDRVHINTIMIDKDGRYVSPTGVKLGDTAKSAKRGISDIRESKPYLIDMQRGIVYWHKNQRIDRIVLCGDLLK